MPAGLTLLLTSPRIAAGLLSWPAWACLREADLVLARDDPHEQEDALAGADVAVRRSTAGSSREQARELVEAARDGQVVWLGSADGDPGLTDALADELSRVAVNTDPPPVEVLVASHDVPGARLLDLVAVMDRLRSPGGCPWDREQTHASLAPYLIEETYELAEAIDTQDRVALEEELGDLLLQVAFHARLAEEDEQAPFGIDDVAAGIVAKLVRRHPHVFGAATGPTAGPAPGTTAGTADGTAGGSSGDGGEPVTTAAHVEANWEQIKVAEKGRASVLDGVPLALPALARADKVLGRVARADLAAASDESPGDGGTDGGAEETGSERGWDFEAVGETLLRVVERARGAGVDAEGALRAAVRRLEAEARVVERSRASTRGAT